MLGRFFACLSFCLCFTIGLTAQSAPASSSTLAETDPNVTPKLDYPDSPSGLEHLVKDILKAQKTNDGTRADSLLKSLVVPDARKWYAQAFGETVGGEPELQYEKSANAIPPTLARYFLNAAAQNLTEVSVVRFDKSCDDNAGEDTFGILHARLEAIPLYELRLINGNKFLRLFAFAYVAGGFRYIITPKMDGKVFNSPASDNPAAAKAASTNPPDIRVRVGGAVQAAKLLRKVQPEYPSVARGEHLEGTVRLRALIAKDGTLRKLYVIKGYCSLSSAALKAVSEWRYAPTLINSSPVEIDTEIQVIYSLQR